MGLVNRPQGARSSGNRNPTRSATHLAFARSHCRRAAVRRSTSPGNALDDRCALGRAAEASQGPIEPLSTIVAPAARISAIARSPSPAVNSTARQPSSITQVSNPSSRASSVVAFTQ